MLPKMVVTDLDGTVVRSDFTVSDYTHQVMERCSRAGIPVVGATGRGPRLTGTSRSQLPSAAYFVLGGGSRVLDLTGDAPVTMRDVRFPSSALAALMPGLEERFGPLKVTVEVLDADEAPLWSEDSYWPYPDMITLHTREELFEVGPVIKAFLQVDAEVGGELVDLARKIVAPETIEVIQAWPGFVEICAPNVDKAIGCTLVTDHLGIKPEEVIVFGDQLNDVPIFRWAGHRVAVGNAHPELIELADEVAASNDEDGVAAYLDRLLAGLI
ncbi:hydroxymethylpyrimidine pyrophosphatase-like HAD family hydrolase [Allocatelliglobosispora scoriae]|uniref:Hydroxymethylpyrimidine pyrophosphatase-like HAD family hydrolase n=1 Tax=Allocatelliglobosispora scoriae TaxID=643052 RepID=A0A841BW16_9ACTN|nr:HAD hydrolase family protein [Allocatelliglobosispora scoriae]MBB5870931.1 hydroxymethylpyrimidine pyrophosphatase-like HAD family hydrolase [Allocatelliglobosispora scoriae]